MLKLTPLLLSFVLVGCGARTALQIGDFDDASVIDDADPDVVVTDTVDEAEAPVPCRPGIITLDKARPAVMMVLDRSGSMGRTLGSTPGTRWQILTNALASTMPAVDQTMQIGALLFPTGNSGTSCSVAASPDLVPALGNVTAMITRMRSARPNGGTPTAVAIDAAAEVLLGRRAATAARAMVLATDGAPVCNRALDPDTCRCASPTSDCDRRPELCLDDERTVKALASHAASGLPTYVIGIAPNDTGGFPDVLDAMALAGGRPKPDGVHRYYGADSEAELDAALVAIRNQVGACMFLTASVPDTAGAITLLLDGVPVPYDETGTDGWSWVDKTNGQIALHGDPCDRTVGSTAFRIEARVECSDAGR